MSIPDSWYPYLYGLAGALVAKAGDLVIARGTRRDTYYDGIRGDVAALRTELTSKDERIDKLEAQMDTDRTAHHDREDALYRRISQLQGRIAELEGVMRRHNLPVPAWGEESQKP